MQSAGREAARVAEAPAVNVSPLIVLAQGGCLDLLRIAGERILVPVVVEQEVLRPGITDAAVQALRSRTWLEIVEVGPVPASVGHYRLDPGEEAVLTWAATHPGAAAIMDDRRGRLAARSLGIPVIGTLGIILEAKRAGVIPAARPVAGHLLGATDWYLSRHILARVLARVGE